MTIGTGSLFETNGVSPLGDAAAWLTGTMLGSVAVTLCVLAVAFVGLLMLTGRVAFREGFRVVLGCFILLGAPIIASAFLAVAQPTARVIEVPPVAIEAESPRGELPPANFDPYAGASLRRD